MLDAKTIKEKAIEFGASVVGIGDIKYFEGTNPQRDPKQILPNAKCVIGFGFRVPRAFYKTMDAQRQYFNYTQVGVKYIDEDLAEIFLLKMGGLIENEGYDACLQRNISNLRIKGDKTTNPELIDTYELVHAEPINASKPPPDIIMDFNQAAQICGLGSVGRSGHLIVPKIGPFVRLVFIVTDAPLECDEPFTKNFCEGCDECIKGCPGKAIGENDVNTWQCAVYYRGAHKSNPFMTDEFLKGDPEREAIINGDKVFDRESARAIYPKLDFLPSQTGYSPCLCGRKCDMVCYKHLKEINAL
jgi:epoxyqueuosine reductase QueG